VSSLAPDTGAIIGGAYQVLTPLGRGAMGVVMLARDLVLERLVAIKIIRPEMLDSEELRVRFLAEARAMARVNHPNVLHIHAFGDYQGAPYFVMEFVKGKTLESWMRPSGGDVVVPPLEESLRVLDATCLGVEAIHAAKTVHRDLKPSNILLGADLRVHVADLGVANLVTRTDTLTPATREIVGTPSYMAPEIALQEEIPAELTPRADVYSLGCIAYELLTGAPPFEGRTMLAIMMKHASSIPERPSLKNPMVPPELDDVLLRALAKDPSNRTPSAEAFRRELAAARDGTSEPVRILVAEDDEDFRGALEFTLAQEFPHAEIECVADGAAALQAFQSRHHSVAILDLRMPGLDGMELTQKLRAETGAEAVPIIVLTASGGPEEWRQLAAMGADGFLLKPVNLKDVVTLVRRALGERSSRSLPPSRSLPAARELK
jgi:serine/threonine protein kinase